MLVFYPPFRPSGTFPRKRGKGFLYGIRYWVITKRRVLVLAKRWKYWAHQAG